jgi:tryptophan synthase alpha chain
MTGVTGGQVADGIPEYLRGVRARVVRNPILVGFGISTPEQAVSLGAMADGVIIGSALLRQLEKADTDEALVSWVRGFRDSLDRM